jgi:cyclopropane-fatty-acyl-phospholipid synthase
MSELTVDHSADGPRDARIDERLARQTFLKVLERLESGRLELVEPDGQRHVRGPDPVGSELHVVVQIHDPRFWRLALTGGSAGVGEAFMEGMWSCEDLARLVRIFARNSAALSSWNQRMLRFTARLQKAWLWARRNTIQQARQNISEHYDLGNEFFASFLDPLMMYSCAIYPRQDSTLEEAARYKLDHICRKLDLKPGDRVLEIGTGWGSLAIVAARDYGAHVTTITISEEQFAHTRERIRSEGLGDRIDLRLVDYREVDGQYDKLVSVEMIEAVGAEHLDTYLNVCSDRLKPDGQMLLQAIVIDDRAYEEALQTVDFIKKFIFPGSFIPSPQAMADALARVTDLRLIQLEDLTPNYARTLSDWHDRFVAAFDRIRKFGFDDRFERCWQFYFKYCEGGFTERRIGVQQLLYAKPGSRRAVPLVAFGQE